MEKKFKRKLRNYLIKPREQMSHALIVVATVLVSLGSMAILLLTKIDTLFHGISMNLEVLSLKEQLVNTLFQYFFAASVILSVILACISIVHTHRVFGAIFAIEKYLEQLVQDSPVSELHSRVTNQAGRIPELLNKLVQKMKEKGH